MSRTVSVPNVPKITNAPVSHARRFGKQHPMCTLFPWTGCEPMTRLKTRLGVCQRREWLFRVTREAFCPKIASKCTRMDNGGGVNYGFQWKPNDLASKLLTVATDVVISSWFNGKQPAEVATETLHTHFTFNQSNTSGVKFKAYFPTFSGVKKESDSVE